MELFLSILTMLGIVLLGFMITEAAAAFFDKQGKGLTPYFSFIGVEFNQKDAQRLLLSFLIGAGIMILLPYIKNYFDFEINGYVIYLITGISPTTIVFFAKKKFKEKLGLNDEDLRSTSGGHSNPKHEQH